MIEVFVARKSQSSGQVAVWAGIGSPPSWIFAPKPWFLSHSCAFLRPDITLIQDGGMDKQQWSKKMLWQGTIVLVTFFLSWLLSIFLLL